VCTKIFDAKGWVPQSRKRIYFVGFRNDLADAAERFAWPEEPEACDGTVEDVLEDEGDCAHSSVGGKEVEAGSGGGSGGGGGSDASLFLGHGNEAASACEVSQYQMERGAAFFLRRDVERGGVEGVDYQRHPGYLSAVDGVARTLCASYRKSSAYYAELVPPPLGEAYEAEVCQGVSHKGLSRERGNAEAGEGEGAGEGVGAGETGRGDGAQQRRRRQRPRYYTVREAARLQGFPETFHPDPERGYHELGNAVVPPLVRSVGAAVLKALEEGLRAGG